jgi:kinesin family protein 13
MFKSFQYLDSQIQKYINKPDKSDAELEREQSLVDQWVCLTEERNSVMVPASGSGVPGAPADWEPPDGVETHSPVLFLDLGSDSPIFKHNGQLGITVLSHASKLRMITDW